MAGRAVFLVAQASTCSAVYSSYSISSFLTRHRVGEVERRVCLKTRNSALCTGTYTFGNAVLLRLATCCLLHNYHGQVMVASRNRSMSQQFWGLEQAKDAISMARKDNTIVQEMVDRLEDENNKLKGDNARWKSKHR